MACWLFLRELKLWVSYRQYACVFSSLPVCFLALFLVISPIAHSTIHLADTRGGWIITDFAMLNFGQDWSITANYAFHCPRADFRTAKSLAASLTPCATNMAESLLTLSQIKLHI